MSSFTAIAPSQKARLERFGAERSVDAHCHVLPGIDDGPADLFQALALCRLLVDDGFTDIIATPHQLGRWDGATNASTIRQAVTKLQEHLKAHQIPLTIHPGGEIRLDERIPNLLGAGTLLTFADMGAAILLELPGGVAVDPASVLPFLRRGGGAIVLAHAERYESLVRDPRVAQAWVDNGAMLQINAPTFELGPDDPARIAAWDWLMRGWVKIVATDAHSANSRRPRMSEAVEQILKRCGIETARRVCIENPSRLLEGHELI
jgi:protein-tyrosine phosphatase